VETQILPHINSSGLPLLPKHQRVLSSRTHQGEWIIYETLFFLRRKASTLFHALVITAFFLGQYRTRDEDLFGMVCCLMAVERHVDMDPWNLSDKATCSHEEMSPEQLATKLSAFQVGWPPEAERGWEMIINILQEGEDPRKLNLREGIAPLLPNRIKNQESFDSTSQKSRTSMNCTSMI